MKKYIYFIEILVLLAIAFLIGRSAEWWNASQTKEKQKQTPPQEVIEDTTTTPSLPTSIEALPLEQPPTKQATVSPPSCQTYTDKASCEAQDCTWDLPRVNCPAGADKSCYEAAKRNAKCILH